VLNPLYTAISWVLLRWHDLFSTFMAAGSGITWALSIFMLVVTIRILLFRFFIKQVHNQRKMQELQPKIQALRAKYKDDRQTLSQEMLKLQREEGFNPLGGCLPILLQAPVFFALFHVLRLVGGPNADALTDEYGWSAEQTASAGRAKLFGAPIAAAFRDSADRISELGGTVTATRIVTFVLIVLMSSATYITQRQIMARSGTVLDGQQAMIQKLLLYGIPISLFFSGFFFPLGVLLYWFTNNLFTMGQQFYILKRMPHPSTVRKETAPSVDPKLLAPKPGQKPVNPKGKRPATTTAAGAAPAAGNPDGQGPNDAAGAAPTGQAEQAEQAEQAGQAGQDATPSAPAGGAADGKRTSGSTPASSTPRPGRRPSRQRSSTTTRPKKKRR
jgi:YidC/Oxa1 family membrane protein insertase